jgi:hypothetical protein
MKSFPSLLVFFNTNVHCSMHAGSQGRYEPPVFIEDELESSGYDSHSSDESDDSDVGSRAKPPKEDVGFMIGD